MSDALLLEAVRALRVADPDLGFKPLLAKLREQQPDLGAATKEVREALTVLKAEGEAAKAAAAPPAADEGVSHAANQGVPPAADEGASAPSPAALSLACIGCARLPSEMGDDREKHPVCPKCVKLKVPTAYWCCVDCPGNPGAWKLHAVYHKKVKKLRTMTEDGGEWQQRAREIAEEMARDAAQTGDEYDELVAEGVRHASKDDWRRAARAFREAIALRPDRPVAYYNLGAVLSNSGHQVEAAQRYLEAKERWLVGSKDWAAATASVVDMLGQEECRQVAKPEWWNDEELKALSARVVKAAPNNIAANQMRAMVLCGMYEPPEVAPRSAAELREAAAYLEQCASMGSAPAQNAMFADHAEFLRSKAANM